jgi:3-hydroxy-9,10-secoandrosta-1,3,5(10)-triene-9,17-dione monooxygenase reductase component
MSDGTIAAGATVQPDAFRAACAQFATGVSVVMTSTSDGDFGLTVTAFTSLTLDPPQVIVCLARTSNTWAAIRRAQVFTVNVLAADQIALARLFATTHPDKARLMGATARRGLGGVPLLDGALSTLECRLVDAIAQSTHVVLIGEVVRVEHDPNKAPALHFRSHLYEGFAAAVVHSDQ